MSSKKLSTPEDLTSYSAHHAFIRIFTYSPLQQLDHLICIHGDRGQGAQGEVAHLKISAAAYHSIAERYPIAERESHLFRSDFFEVKEVLKLVQTDAMPVAEEL